MSISDFFSPLDKINIPLLLVSYTNYIEGLMQISILILSFLSVFLSIYIKLKNYQLQNEEKRKKLLHEDDNINQQEKKQ